MQEKQFIMLCSWTAKLFCNAVISDRPMEMLTEKGREVAYFWYDPDKI